MTTSSLVITGPIFRFCNKKAPHKICIFLFPFISYYILCLYGILLFVTLTLQYNVDVESQVDICVIIIARYIYNNIYTHTHIHNHQKISSCVKAEEVYLCFRFFLSESFEAWYPPLLFGHWLFYIYIYTEKIL